MTLVKLDSGDYINTEQISMLIKLLDNNGYRVCCEAGSVVASPADRDRIVEAMQDKYLVSAKGDGIHVEGKL